MRIGIISFGLDRAFSGIGRYSIDLIRALSKIKKGSIEVFNCYGGKNPGPLASEDVINIKISGCNRYPLFASWGNLEINRIIKDYSIDIIHDITGTAPLYFSSNKIKSLLTLHDVFPLSIPGYNTFFDNIVYKHWLPIVLPKIDSIITPSQYSKDDIHRHLGVSLNKIHVVPSGINDVFSPVHLDELNRIRIKYKLPDEYILFVGGIQKRKNLPKLIESCKRIWNLGFDIKLVVVGLDTLNYGKIRTQFRLKEGECKNIIGIGRVPTKDLPGIYSGATIFVFPSLYEGFGFPPLEAMACGTPVLSSNISSLPEVVGDAAITFNPNNPEEIASRIIRVLDEPKLRRSMELKGLAQARKFNWITTARNLLNIYNED